jgi:hypothetical protein
VAVGTGARGGGILPVSATLVVRKDGQRIVLDAGRSGLYLLRGETVVAVARAAGVPAVPLPLTQGKRWPAQTLPTAIRLRDCAGAALAPGTYRLVAVVGYGNDPLNAGGTGAAGSFALVGAPTNVTVG